MSVGYSHEHIENTLLTPTVNQPRLKTALVGYRLDENFIPLLSGEDILGLNPEKRTPAYLARVITARVAHHLAYQRLGEPIVWGEQYGEKEQYGLRLSDDMLLKTRWKPSLILLRSKNFHPETLTPTLRLDSLLETDHRKYIVKTANEPVSDERSSDIGLGMLHLRRLLDGRNYSLLLYSTPEAGEAKNVRDEMRQQRIGFEQHLLPFTAAEAYDAATAAHDTYLSGKIQIDVKDLKNLRLVG